MQFSDDDLEAAVAAGAVPAETAAGFRAFVERRASPAADEESFRLLTGFNDIFVAIAAIMVLAALGWLGAQKAPGYAGLLIAAASWALAEFFTRRRRMALPSILLLLAFVGGVAANAVTLARAFVPQMAGSLQPFLFIGGATALAAFGHWRRFRVPITVAAGAFAVGATIVMAVIAFDPSTALSFYVILAEGLGTFALALAWDMSDPLRQTRRADVAFWLHLLAAPAIVHPLFMLLGLTQWSPLAALGPHAATPGVEAGGLAFGLYTALGVVALIVDRRALMVSSLAYLLVAMNSLFQATGALTLSVALSALIVGAGLLLLSAFWTAARREALWLAPEALRQYLPPAS